MTLVPLLEILSLVCGVVLVADSVVRSNYSAYILTNQARPFMTSTLLLLPSLG